MTDVAQPTPAQMPGAPVPFHEVPLEPGAPAPSRRLLLISYNFPPSQAVGGLRWQKMARFAAERGWGVDVVCLDPTSLAETDDGRLADLPPGTRLYGVAGARLRFQRWVDRAWMAVRPALRRNPIGPGSGTTAARRAAHAYGEYARDAEWAAAATRVARRVVTDAHQIVVSSGPPHMVHEAACSVAREAALPFVMDMRDPWSLVQRLPDHLQSPLYYSLAQRHERRCVAAAALVATNTEHAARALRAVHPAHAERIVTVMNGSDDEALPPQRVGGPFVLAYAGVVYLDRDPRPLFRAAARVVAELGLTADDFRIEFIGVVQHLGGVTLDAMARDAGLEGYATFGPPRPRREAITFLADATMLVVLPQDSGMAVPSKVFEYARTEAWLLALADHDSATGVLLAGTGADVVSPSDEEALVETLRRRYAQHASGERPRAVDADGRFNRRTQARVFFDAIDSLARPARSSDTSISAAPNLPPEASQPDVPPRRRGAPATDATAATAATDAGVLAGGEARDFALVGAVAPAAAAVESVGLVGDTSEHTVDPLLQAPPRSADETRRALDRSLVVGIAWTGAAKWATQVLRWLATLVIARQLTPGDYGIVGMAMVYLGLVQLVNEFGLSSAIIQQRDLTRDDVAKLGGLSVAIGVCFFGISTLISPLIAMFFGEPAVRAVIIVLSAKFIIDSVNAVPRAVLSRELRFTELAWIEGLEAVALAGATLAAALLGYGYWSLVIGVICSAVAAAVLLLVRAPHPIKLPRDLSTLRRSVLFGRDVVIARVAWYSYSNADFAVVGRVLDKASLGAYTFAWDLASIPVEKVSAMIGRVTPAIFSAVQNEPSEMRRYLLLLTEGIAFVTFPLSLGMFLVAPDFVAVMLGPKWLAAVTPMRLLALYAGFRSITTLLPQIMIASGRPDATRRFSLIALVILPLCFLLGSHWGTKGVALGWIVGYPICVIPFDIRFTFRLLSMRHRDYVTALRGPTIGSAVMAAAVCAVLYAMRADASASALRLGLSVGAGAAAYCGVVYVAYRKRLAGFRSALGRVRTPAV